MTKRLMRNLAETLAIVTILFGLSYAYLYPGSRLLFDGSTTQVMSDDTDPSPLPYAYANVLRSLREDPTRFFYGAVFVGVGDPEHGAAAWIPWSERTLIWALADLVPLEQLSTAVVFALLILTGLSFYGLARAWLWPRTLALALSVAWAFCPFERARAKVHMAMVGTYHLPLIFLGLWLIARRGSRRHVVAGALCLLIACTTFQYFVITAAALAPLFLTYVWVVRERTVGSLLARLAAASLPAVLFLGWNVTHPLPTNVDIGGASAFPRTGDFVPGQRHPFLWTYAAHPLDYLVGDIALAGESRDVLPLRARVNDLVRADLGYGNTHERTNGVRWVVIALAAWALLTLRGRDRRAAWFFAAFAAACFWLSMNPDAPVAGLGLSGWLQDAVAQIRVPSRAGIGVHFALLTLAGLGLVHARRGSRWLLIPGVLPALIVAEYPPLLNPMPVANVRAAYLDLTPSGRRLASVDAAADRRCGTGLLFPVVTDDVYSVVYYHFKQRLRNTGCAMLNASTDPAVVNGLLNRFPTSPAYLGGLERNVVVEDRLIDLARCAHLNWIAFDPITPPRLRDAVCTRLNWAMNADLTCVDPAAAPNTGAIDRACF